MKLTKALRNEITVVLLIYALAGCSKTSENSQTEAAANDLPSMDIYQADGTQVQVKNLTGKVMLILFFPDCDHCQREAAEIQQNLRALENYSLYFITTTPFAEIDAFAQQFKLSDYSNVKFCRTSNKSVLDSFGPIDTPSLYIFSDQVLVKAFNGETPISEILKYI